MPGRFKDHISQPKSNGYRSIHTTVSGRDGKRVEVRSAPQMHAVAETGVRRPLVLPRTASASNPFAVDPFQWLRSITERFENSEDPSDFLEHVKLEMFRIRSSASPPKAR